MVAISNQDTNQTSLQSLLVPVKNEVSRLEAMMHSLLSSEVPFVRSVAEYIIDNGGKRVRPILTVLGAKMSGYTEDRAYHMAACIEFIHTASLLHDDVIDNAKVRRGRPSANAKWGNHVSVLVGDFFYCRASQLLTAQGDLAILKTVTDSITALTEGEVLEIVTNAELKTTEQDYLKIIEFKTAKLFAAACKVGGLLGKVSDELVTGLEQYGYNLGMAFQLADDALDYLSSDDVLGKTTGTDLQEGKLTLPLIVALQAGDEKEVQLIKNTLLAERLETTQFQDVHAIIKKYNGFERTYERARWYVQKAKTSLNPFRQSLEKDILFGLADYVIQRNS